MVMSEDYKGFTLERGIKNLLVTIKVSLDIFFDLLYYNTITTNHHLVEITSGRKTITTEGE